MPVTVGDITFFVMYYIKKCPHHLYNTFIISKKCPHMFYNNEVLTQGIQYRTAHTGYTEKNCLQKLYSKELPRKLHGKKNAP